MKKYIFLLLLCMIFLACKNNDSEDKNENTGKIPLVDAKISVDIQNIVRYGLNGEEHVFVSNGEISHRSVEGTDADSKSDFQSFANPSGFVYALASDSINLYALSVVVEEDDDGYNVAKTRGVYCYNAGSWVQIWSANYSKSSTARFFCTNTPKPENRHAYFRYGSTVWELNGTTGLTSDNAMATGSVDNTTTPTTGVKSCTTLGTTVYFSTAEAMTSNETKDVASTYIYRSNGANVLYSTNGTDWTSVNLDCDSIQTIAVTKDFILVGTKKGIVHQSWKTTAFPTGGIPNSGNTSFSTNATSTLSSYYEIPSVLVIDTSQVENGTTIFASGITSSSSVSLNNLGLWSYYANEGEWKRE